jgi:hypothetical protein
VGGTESQRRRRPAVTKFDDYLLYEAESTGAREGGCMRDKSLEGLSCDDMTVSSLINFDDSS